MTDLSPPVGWPRLDLGTTGRGVRMGGNCRALELEEGTSLLPHSIQQSTSLG